MVDIDGRIGYDNLIVTITDQGLNWGLIPSFDFLLYDPSYIEYIGFYMEEVVGSSFTFGTKQPWLDDGYGHPSLAPKVTSYSYTGAMFQIPKGDSINWKIRYSYHVPDYNAVRYPGETVLTLMTTPTEAGVIDLMPVIIPDSNVKTRQTINARKRRRSSIQAPRKALSSWSRSDRSELNCPDYYGFNVDATSILTGFEDGDLAIAPDFKGENVTYTINAAQNRINFTSVGIVLGFTWNGKTFSCANGVCALSTDNLKFYFENAVFGGFFVSDFKPLDQFGGVKIGDKYVINNASSEAQVEV